MNTQVTQKKKLSLKAQKPDEADAESAASEDVSGPVVAERRAVDSSYHTPGAVMAIIASVIVLSLIALQAIEWAYYKASPSVWPPKPAGAIR